MYQKTSRSLLCYNAKGGDLGTQKVPGVGDRGLVGSAGGRLVLVKSQADIKQVASAHLASLQTKMPVPWMVEDG